MNRNDILRELELLPAWQLKAGVQVRSEVQSKSVVAEQYLPVAQLTTKVPESVLAEPITIARKQAVNLLVLLNKPKSEDFYASEQGLLLDNMLKAIALKRGENLVVAFDSEEIQAYEAQFVLVLGEQAAQQMLNTSEPLSTLRGKLHQVSATQVIVSHDLDYLLLHPLAKREAWQDLKLLKTVSNHLQSSQKAP